MLVLGMIKKRTRKPRSDRKHIIYSIQYESYCGDIDEYVGVTVVNNGNVWASFNKRWMAHIRAAKQLKKKWKLSEAIREHGVNAFDFEILETVRGKELAHKVERSIIRERKPSLNTDNRAKEEDIDAMRYYVLQSVEKGKKVWLDKQRELVYDIIYAEVMGHFEVNRRKKWLDKNGDRKWIIKSVTKAGQ